MSSDLPAPSTILVFPLLDHDLLGPAEHVQRCVLELDAELAAHLAAGQHRDDLEHCPAARRRSSGRAELHDALEPRQERLQISRQ